MVQKVEIDLKIGDKYMEAQLSENPVHHSSKEMVQNNSNSFEQKLIVCS